MEASQNERGPGKNKRKWTSEEDAKLVEILLELHNTGLYKADNGFKSGMYKAVKTKIESKLPGCGLKAKPHIESRMKTLKTQFGKIYDMLYGNTSGFGWDPIKQCVTAEKAVWDAYCTVHRDADKVRDTPFPYFDDLSIVFGKDRATGKDVEAPIDVVEELNREETNHEGVETQEGGLDDISNSMPFSDNPIEQTYRSSKRRKSGGAYDFGMVEIMKEAIAGIKDIKESSTQLSKAIGLDITEKQMSIDGELLKIASLTTRERHKAGCMIGYDAYRTNIFFSIPENEKEEWVKALLNNEL